MAVELSAQVASLMVRSRCNPVTASMQASSTSGDKHKAGQEVGRCNQEFQC